MIVSSSCFTIALRSITAPVVPTRFNILITQVNEWHGPYSASLTVKLEITVMWSGAQPYIIHYLIH